MRVLYRFSKLAAISVASVSMVWGGVVALPSRAETFLEEAGTITPAEDTYNFEGSEGQTITITLDSEEFDPVLSLFDSSGEEIATNDDFGGTLNAAIILSLPANDTYTVIARSLSGQGGDYTLTVRSSTEYEVTYDQAQALVMEENYPAAIEAYTEAIDLDPEQSSAYLGRAEAYLWQVYSDQESEIQGPEDIPADIRESIIADFEAAASLIEASGPQAWADSLREQADLLRTGEQPDMELE